MIKEIKHVLAGLDPDQHWGEDEFFYYWLDDINFYNWEIELKKNRCNIRTLKKLNKLDQLIESFYKKWKGGEKFNPMWEKIKKEKALIIKSLEKDLNHTS